jgi:hypothetical protein
MNAAQFSNYPSYTRVNELAQWMERIKSYYVNKGKKSLTNRELETLSFAYLQELLSEFIDEKAIPAIEEVVDFVSHDRPDLKYSRPNHTGVYFYSLLALYAVVGAGFITMWHTDVTDKAYDAVAENHLLNSRLAEIKENRAK